MNEEMKELIKEEIIKKEMTLEESIEYIWSLKGGEENV